MVKYILALKGRIFRAFLYENFYKLEMDNKKPREGEKGNILRWFQRTPHNDDSTKGCSGGGGGKSEEMR